MAFDRSARKEDEVSSAPKRALRSGGKANPPSDRIRPKQQSKGNGLPRQASLKGLDFLRVMAKGEKCSCPSFYLYYMPAGEFQAGVCVSRRLGGAVVRNRIKRVLRESIRLTRSSLARPYHLVLVARRGAEDLDVQQARYSLTELYGTARLASEAVATS